MLKWLNMYIEKNQYLWERRRTPVDVKRGDECQEWLKKNKEEQIQVLKEDENENEEGRERLK